MSTFFALTKVRQHCTELVETIHFFSQRGWCPATSSNFSFRTDHDDIVISRSGVDKSRFAIGDLIHINNQGAVLEPAGQRSSAETLIHLGIYRQFNDARCVLHTHSPLATLLSLHCLEPWLEWQGYEIFKALHGQRTHEGLLRLPVIANAQDMERFCADLREVFKNFPDLPGFLIAGHGLYTWGKSISEAKRHVEAIEFLLECKYREVILA